MAKHTLKEYENTHPVFAAVWRDGDIPIDELIVEWALTQLRSGYDLPAARIALDAFEARLQELADFGGAVGSYWTDRLEAERGRRAHATALGLEAAADLRAHCEAINLEFEEPISEDRVRELLREAPGVKLVDDRERNYFPMAIDGAGADDVLVGRIRRDVSMPDGRGLHLLVAGAQIRKGAALNALQIAERL